MSLVMPRWRKSRSDWHPRRCHMCRTWWATNTNSHVQAETTVVCPDCIAAHTPTL